MTRAGKQCVGHAKGSPLFLHHERGTSEDSSGQREMIRLHFGKVTPWHSYETWKNKTKQKNQEMRKATEREEEGSLTPSTTVRTERKA